MRRIMSVGLAVGLFGVAVAALAGPRVEAEVTVDPVLRVVSGSLGTARNSSDSHQEIGCSVTYSTSGGETASCWGRSAARVYRSCVSSDPQIIATVKTLTGDAYLRFEYNTFATCEYVRVSNSSVYEPKRR